MGHPQRPAGSWRYITGGTHFLNAWRVYGGLYFQNTLLSILSSNLSCPKLGTRIKAAGLFPVSQPSVHRAGPALVNCPASVLGSLPSQALPPQYAMDRPLDASGLTTEPSLGRSLPSPCLWFHPAPSPSQQYWPACAF